MAAKQENTRKIENNKLRMKRIPFVSCLRTNPCKPPLPCRNMRYLKTTQHKKLMSTCGEIQGCDEGVGVGGLELITAFEPSRNENRSN
jgi:hypothetical protein